MKNKIEDLLKYDFAMVDFYAEWCGPCKLLAPILEEISKQYSNLKLIKINVDENAEIANKYGVSSLPAILLFKKGEVVERLSGLQSKETLTEKINNYLSNHDTH
jgi:thioredoxin 1